MLKMSRIGLLFGVLVFFAAAGLTTQTRAQTPLSVGSQLPDVGTSLQRLDGSSVSPQELSGDRATVFVFWSNECPWVDKYEGRVAELASRFEGRGVQFVLVNANDASDNPEESLSASRKKAKDSNYRLPYLRDSNATFAKALGATRTPQAFVFGAEGRLVYRGAIDDSPSNPGGVEKSYLDSVLDAVVNGRSVSVEPKSSFGCTLKYPG